MTTSLKDSNTAIKTYWAILNRLLYNKMIPAIPPLLVYGSFILDCWTKANVFKNLFASICTPTTNNSVLPPLLYKTSSRISSFRVANKDILWITKSIDSSKSHGYDNNSVKSVHIQSFSGPYFSAFGLNTEWYLISLQSKCGKYGPEKLRLRTLYAVWALQDTVHNFVHR